MRALLYSIHKTKKGILNNMDDETWYSETYNDYILLRKKQNFWKGIGEGFEFKRGTKKEVVLLLKLWGYELSRANNNFK